MYDVSLKRVRADVVAGEKQYVYMFRKFVWRLRYPACNIAWAIFSSVVVRLYNIFPG